MYRTLTFQKRKKKKERRKRKKGIKMPAFHLFYWEWGSVLSRITWAALASYETRFIVQIKIQHLCLSKGRKEEAHLMLHRRTDTYIPKLQTATTTTITIKQLTTNNYQFHQLDLPIYQDLILQYPSAFQPNLYKFMQGNKI